METLMWALLAIIVGMIWGWLCHVWRVLCDVFRGVGGPSVEAVKIEAVAPEPFFEGGYELTRFIDWCFRKRRFMCFTKYAIMYEEWDRYYPDWTMRLMKLDGDFCIITVENGEQVLSPWGRKD